jgi:hypothetical protein
MSDDDNEYETHAPSEGVVDDTNTAEGQLMSARAPLPLSRHLALQVQKYLSGMTYPADKTDIYDYAMSKGAGQELLGSLERLQQKSYESAEALHEEIFSQS